MAQLKAQNDPWSPLPEETVGISQPPADPRHQLIDSDRYIESLEKKLKRLKGKNKPEPSSRDIINSLAGFRDDQMRRFLNNGHATDTPTTSIINTDVTTSSGSTSYLQRRLHPERQALNMEELFELLKDDELARNRPEEEDDSGDSAPQTECARLSEVCEKDAKSQSDGDCSKSDTREHGQELKPDQCSLSENDCCGEKDVSKESEKDVAVASVSDEGQCETGSNKQSDDNS